MQTIVDYSAPRNNIFSCVMCKAANYLGKEFLAEMQETNCHGFHDCAGVALVSFDMNMPQEVITKLFGTHVMIRESVADIFKDTDILGNMIPDGIIKYRIFGRRIMSYDSKNILYLKIFYRAVYIFALFLFYFVYIYVCFRFT